jgi:hypothetical protein
VRWEATELVVSNPRSGLSDGKAMASAVPMEEQVVQAAMLLYSEYDSMEEDTIPVMSASITSLRFLSCPLFRALHLTPRANGERHEHKMCAPCCSPSVSSLSHGFRNLFFFRGTS